MLLWFVILAVGHFSSSVDESLWLLVNKEALVACKTLLVESADVLFKALVSAKQNLSQIRFLLYWTLCSDIMFWIWLWAQTSVVQTQISVENIQLRVWRCRFTGELLKVELVFVLWDKDCWWGKMLHSVAPHQSSVEGLLLQFNGLMKIIHAEQRDGCIYTSSCRHIKSVVIHV